MAAIVHYISTWSHRVLPVSLARWRSSPKVLSLPDEIWTLVILELELKDVVNARLVCRFMHDICTTRVIWRRLFLEALREEIPTPFFLPRPLKEISAKSIESTMRAWRLGWMPTVPLQHFNRRVNKTVLGGQRLDLESILLAPGGRWAIATSSVGSVWWFDLSDHWTSTEAVEPRILIPSTLTVPEESNDRLQIKIAIDFSSDEALGSSIHDHHLSRFNIAVVARPAERSPSSLARIGVWRINVSGESGGRLVLGDCLSNYEETEVAAFTDVSLYGTVIAYGMDSGNFSVVCVVIVEWANANKSTRDGDIMRRYIPSYPAKKVMLLPGGRILLVRKHHCADLINWQRDVEISALPPSEQANADYTPPIWSYDESKRGPIHSEAMAHPLVFSDAIRLVIPASRNIYGLTIARDDSNDDEDAVQIQTLFRGHWKMHQSWQVFAYRQAVGSRNARLTFFSAQYRWRDDSSGGMARFAEVSIPDGMLNSPRFVTRYDQYSQRIILVEKDGSQFVTLASPSS